MGPLRLPIHDPCHERWDAMHSESESRRFCERCSTSVHDLSSMTEPEARQLLQVESQRGSICVRYRADRHGALQFRAATTDASSLWRSTLVAAGMALMLAQASGCVEAQPDEIRAEVCVYEQGPWSFTIARGHGTCPAPSASDTLSDPGPSVELVEPSIEIPLLPPAVEDPDHRQILGRLPRGPLNNSKRSAPDTPLQPEPEPEPVKKMGKIKSSPERPCDP